MRTKRTSAAWVATGLAAMLAFTACGDDSNDTAASTAPTTQLAAAATTMDGKDVATVAGPTVKVTVDGSIVKINDATVTTADVEASNGVIHVIDKVLLPPS